MAERPFLNNPNQVIRDHLNTVGLPDTDSIGTVSRLIQTINGSDGGTGGILRLCRNIAGEVTLPTTAFAAVLEGDDKITPSHWRESPEFTRAVVTMCGYVELGMLRAEEV